MRRLVAASGSVKFGKSGWPISAWVSLSVSGRQETKMATLSRTRAAAQKIPVFAPSFTLVSNQSEGMDGSKESAHGTNQHPDAYFNRDLEMFSRSRSRRDANTITPITSGGMQGSAT